MKLESKDLDNIFQLVNHFCGICKDKLIRLVYEPDFETIEIEVIDADSLETLKSIRYKTLCQEDLEELEDILRMYIDKETFEKLEDLYTNKGKKWED